MKSSKLLPIGFLAVGLIGTTAMIATAQDTSSAQAEPAAAETVHRAEYRGDKSRGEHKARGGHKQRGKHRGHRGGRGGGEMFRTLFDAVDADGDKSVTQAEVDAYRTAKLAEVDASGDGALSIEEFDTFYRELTRSRMVDTFQELDADGNSVISAEEMDTRIARMFERMDRDGDGALTLQRRGGRGQSETQNESDN